MRNNYLLTGFATLAGLVSSCSTLQRPTQEKPTREQRPIFDIYNKNDRGNYYWIKLELDPDTAKRAQLYGMARFSRILESHLAEVIGDIHFPQFYDELTIFRNEQLAEKAYFIETLQNPPRQKYKTPQLPKPPEQPPIEPKKHILVVQDN